MDDNCFITCVPGVQGGQPVVRGTRTPVSTIVVLFQTVYSGDREAIQQSLPHLSLDQIDAALEFYAAHRDEIDAIIERDEALLQRFARTA